MKFDFKNGLIWVSINLEYEGKDKKIENCILDTGSATTALDIDLVEFNYRKSSTVKRLIGIGGGTQEVISQQVEKITIDQIPIENIEVEFGDIQADLGINGFIGNDTLKNFDISIKFSIKELFLKLHERF